MSGPAGTFLETVAGYAAAAAATTVRPVALGTIDASYVTSTFPATLPKVTFDGETTLSGKRYPVASPYWPVAGDRVVLVPCGNTYVITGSIESALAGIRSFGTLRFASSSARDAALTGLGASHEGLVAYLADTDLWTFYNGSLWDVFPGQLLYGRKLSTNPIITAASFSSETNIPNMQLTATVVSGASYEFCGQLVNSKGTDTEVQMRIRRTTSVTGTLIGTVRLGTPPNGFGQLATWSVHWTADVTGSTNFYFSVHRTLGTTNTTLEGGDYSFTAIRKTANVSPLVTT